MEMNTPDTEWWKKVVDEDFCSFSPLTRDAINELIDKVVSSRDTYWKERVRDVKFDIEALRGSPRDTDIEYARAITDVHKILDTLLDNLK